MADSLIIIGGVASVLQISSMVVSLVKAVKGAPTDRQRLLIEINATTALCQTLRDYAEIDAETWVETLRTLSQEDTSPVDQFRKSLQYLHKKLTSASKTEHKLQAWVQNLKWPFTKSELLEVITNFERQKSLLNLALTNDNIRLSTAIRNETLRITRKLDDLLLAQDEQDHNTHLIATSIDTLHVHQKLQLKICSIKKSKRRSRPCWLN